MHSGTVEGLNRSVMSMTGFGRGTCTDGGVEVAVEIRAVNHRFLDFSIRMPRIYSSFDPRVRKLLSEHVQRGKLDVTVTRSGTSAGVMDVALDMDLARRYHQRLTELKENLGLRSDITVSDMLTLSEILPPVENERGIDNEWPLVEAGLREALAALSEMRRKEGAATWGDIEAKLDSIREMVRNISPLVDQVAASCKERLQRRVAELTGGLELNEDRLLQEVALIVDRSDVTEELTRLGSHLEQFRAFGKEGSPLGRKLEFLLQEIHREVNTIGSKSASTDIAAYVVRMKADVERIREQTQNIE